MSIVVQIILKTQFFKVLFSLYFSFLVTSKTCFALIDYFLFHNHNKLRQPLLYQVFGEAAPISTPLEPNQMVQGFVINQLTNKESNICLFSVAKETALNEH